jgi:hypothetical protein
MLIITNLIRQVLKETRAQEYQTIAFYIKDIQAVKEELKLYQRT